MVSEPSPGYASVGIARLDCPPQLDALLRDGHQCRGQVDVAPALTARLPATQSAEGDQVIQRIQPIRRGEVQEGPGLLRRPDHHRRRAQAGPPPLLHPFLGPDQGTGPLTARQRHVQARIARHLAPLDRGVQRRLQGGEDPGHGGRADRPPPAGVAALDPVEHLRDVSGP